MMTDIKKDIPLIIGHRGESREAPKNILGSYRLRLQQAESTAP